MPRTPEDGVERGLSPVVGTIVLLAVLVVLAATAGLALQSAASVPADRPRAQFSLTASGDGRVALLHRGGDPVAVDRLRIRIAVDGERLAHQPPVPFFAARGFRAGPTGPFNSRADHRWTAGERATLRVAGTNSPTVTAGSTVEMTMYVDGAPVWEGSTIAD